MTANQEIILAAGSIHTPQILQLSGVGPRTLLESAGIPLVHELPGVGRNLPVLTQIQGPYYIVGGHLVAQLPLSVIARDAYSSIAADLENSTPRACSTTAQTKQSSQAMQHN